MDDDRLMECTADGDEEAFALLVRRWEQPVHAFLQRMVGDREDARDLGQELFLRVFSQAKRYRAQGQFRSWLFRIAGNLSRSHLRRKRILRWLSFDARTQDPPSRAPGPASNLERQELQAAVQEAILALPARQRQALLLRRYEQMSYEEIAGVMEVSLPAVESLLQRSMKSLRRRLSQRGVLS